MICYRCQKDVQDVHTCTPAPYTREEILLKEWEEPHPFDFDRMRATALQAMAYVAELEEKLIRADEVMYKTVTEGVK